MTFEEKLKKYYDKLRDNSELLENIMKNTKSQETLDILLLPNNENELMVADAIFGLMDDMLKTIESAYYGDLKHIDIKDCKITNMYIELINALKSKNNENIEAVKDKWINKCDMKDVAGIMYEFIAVFAQDPEEFCEEIAYRCGFDIYDELSLAQLQLYMSKANEITNKGNENANLDNINNLTDESAKSIVEYANEFHRLYLEGLVEGKNSSLIL